MTEAKLITNDHIKLDALTSFRFLAALMVFLYHGGILARFQTGYLGVSFFFILSGFILSYNYRNKFDTINSYGILSFYSARIAKIYPVHVLTFFIAIPYYFFIQLHHKPIMYVLQAITNLFLVQSYIPFGNFSFNGVSWSLSDEAFFYILFPFILFIILKRMKKNSVKLLFISLVWSIFIVSFLLLPNKNGIVYWLAYIFPGIRIIEFIVGVVLGLIFLEYKDTLSKIPVIIFSLFEITFMAIMIVIIYLSPSFNQYLRYGLIFIPFWSSIIFIFAFGKGILSQFISNRILIYLGNISFSFYMTHNLVFSYILFLWNPNIPKGLTIIICFLITIGMSSILFQFYEEPIRKRLKYSLVNFIIKNSGIVLLKDKYTLNKL